MRYLDKENLLKPNLSPTQKVKRAILANRLKVASLEAERILNRIASETADILGLPQNSISPDTEFASRSLDVVLTINKQKVLAEMK